jgi:hypothetical protein
MVAWRKLLNLTGANLGTIRKGEQIVRRNSGRKARFFVAGGVSSIGRVFRFEGFPCPVAMISEDSQIRADRRCQTRSAYTGEILFRRTSSRTSASPPCPAWVGSRRNPDAAER